MATPLKITDRRFVYQPRSDGEPEQQFSDVFKEQSAESETPTDPKDGYKDKGYFDYTTDLGWYLQSLLSEAKGNRQSIEERWLQDLRQYRGEYDPYIKGRIHPKRSKAFIRLTRTKVKTIDARLGDILFPAGKDKNWGIDPTPIPELNDEMLTQLAQQVQEMSGAEEVTPEQIKEIINEDAKIKSQAMEKEIDDQLAEIKYRDVIRRVLHSGNLYGTGILKGPMVMTKTFKRWSKMPSQEGKEEWKVLKLEKIIPYCEFVSLWDIYPDMSAIEFDNASYVFQRYTMSRNKVVKLSRRDDFNKEAITAYLESTPDGDATYENWESRLRNVEGSNRLSSSAKNEGDPQGYTVARLHNKYNLYEFWGYLNADKLESQGIQIPEDLRGQQEIAANVWMLGPLVIKATLSPIEGVDLPYHFYYFDKDETCIFGEGIPAIMRDPQELANASVRALLDNAAISAGPIIEANIDLLAEGEDPFDIYPFRVFQRVGVGAEAGNRAINIQYQKAYTNEFLSMLQQFITMGDEVTTIPRYMWGEQSNMGQGAGRTATGLSMLMGSVNITMKDQIKNFDDGITIPYIKAHYFWNMEFNPKEEIKGDFSVVAKGTNSLIAKEVKLETLVRYLQVISSFPELIQSIDLKKLNDILTDVLELESITKTQQQLEMENAQRMESMQSDKQFMRTMEILKNISGGHIDDQKLATVLEGLKQ